MNDEFYVGYQPRAPGGLAVFLRRSVGAVALISAGLCALLVHNQTAFDDSTFAYLDYQPRQGVLRLDPYPRLDLHWLVAPGKHGLDALPAEAAGAVATLRGAHIQNGAGTMFEVEPGSIRVLSAASSSSEPDFDLGEASLTGEVVDTKCYLGAMNPGRGKVHRACAARCLSGGIPAGLLVRDANGEARVVILANSVGGPVSRELAPHAGERVTLSGKVIRSRDSLILKLSSDRITWE